MSDFDELELADRLPSPPGLCLTLLNLANDRRDSRRSIVECLRADPALTGRLLSSVNGSASGAGARVATARGAAARLDPLAIRNAALAFCLPPTRAEEICRAFDLRAHWMRSLASAAAAEAIAQRFQVLDPDEAFTLGLLGRVGMLAMATLHPTEFAAILGEAEAGPPGALEAVETRVLQIDHWQAGADLMEAWGLRPHYRDAVAALSRSAAGQATELRVAGSQSLLGLALRMGDGIVRGARGAPADPLVHPAPELRAAHEEAEQQFRELVELCGLGPADGRETEPREPETGLSAKRIPSPPAPAPGASERIAVERTPTRILVVDDDPGARHLLGLHLRRAGYDVISAGDGRAGLAAAFSDAPLMVITDWLMPGLSGLELCQALRKTEAGRRMYLVVLTSREEEDSVVEGLEAGANDYLTKPFNARILLARVQAGERVIELQRQVDLDKLIDRKRVAQMAQLTRRLRSAALLDPLTGLHNRRSAMSTLEDAWSASSRPGGHLSVVMVDIDNFKRVNDEHGHQTGDAVLRAIAEILRNTCRRGDTVCRLGGEEFLVVNAGGSLNEALSCAERLRAAVEESRIAFGTFDGRATISLGAAERSPAMESIDDLLAAADRAVYLAKSRGRNQVCTDAPPRGMRDSA